MPETVTGESGGEPTPRIAGRRVLLVEDDPSVGETLAGVLERHGVRVTLVSSVALGLEALRERTFDAAVSDLMLDDERGRTGFAVLAEARRFQPGVTAVLITGYPSEPIAARAAEEGLAGVLVKPLEIDDLLALLARAPAPTGI